VVALARPSGIADMVSLPLRLDDDQSQPHARQRKKFISRGGDMGLGRGILLWMLGVPLPIILLLAMCSHN